ncbi:MAG: NADH-quinone oxidoreductase subunit A [Bacteroidetes bacterium]|nr:NADH-quinone oxidoreductase subunit A [Bacteroidota bacterium]
MRKNSPYECGFEPVGSPVSDFSPNFLAVALIFLIYDVEILLTFPWAFNTVGRPFAALAVMSLFVILMLLGLIYEIIDGSFEVV